jgi:hypothetical protein
LERGISPLYTTKSKGTENVTLDEMLKLIGGNVIPKTAFGPTLFRTGKQEYITRNIRATVEKI